MEKEWRIKEILNKLTKLQCPMVSNETDEWLIQVLFKPGSERFDLIDWALKKLAVSDNRIAIEGISLENKVNKRKQILSAIGVCFERETDVIEGRSARIKQLEFWELLIGLLSSKVALENSKNNFNVTKECECSVDYISSICENLNFKHAFDTQLQLFPDYYQKEINAAVKKHPEYLSSKELKEKYQDKLKTIDVNTFIGNEISQIPLNLDETIAGNIPHENELTNIEDHIEASACNLNNFMGQFEETYKSLKIYLEDVEEEEFTDIGPSFKVAEEKLQSILQIKNSLNTLVSSDAELEAAKFDITDFEIPSGLLSDEKLAEYIHILSDNKEEK